jgi:uncharacterized protein YukJ
MPLKNYGVWKGRPIDRREGSGKSPHYQVRMVDDEVELRIAVNVQSADGSEVLYCLQSHFEHSLTDGLRELSAGFTALSSKPGGMAIDFIRSNIGGPGDFVPLPISTAGPDNDLNEKLDHYVQRAMADETSSIYAFGERWGPEQNKRDQYFGFLPGNGIHDIHMNQGNDPGHARDDGIYQDGALLFHFPSDNPARDQWVGLFLKFQSQAWHTDDATGHALEFDDGPQMMRAPGAAAPDGLPTTALPDGMVRIVSAVPNGVQSPEVETVTLLNTANTSISLNGWHLADKRKAKTPLEGRLDPGAAVTFMVRAPMALSNTGDNISLINDSGVKVAGVRYTRAQARNPGWSVVF